MTRYAKLIYFCPSLSLVIMIFKGPAGGAALDVPDSIPIWKFMLSDEYGRFPMAKSRHPQVCGITGLSYSIFEVQERVEHLARAIAKDLDWHPNHGTEWDKVVGVYSANTVSLVWLIPTFVIDIE